MWSEHWELDQQNRICFVMVDANYQEVAGLGVALNVFVSKNGGAFVAGAGVVAEIGQGWYTYLATAAEADTLGPVAIYVTGAGCLQQNLEYVVEQRNVLCNMYTYTVTNSVTGLPMAGVEIWVSTDLVAPPTHIIWHGETDTFGVARDDHDQLPCLDTGTYYFWKQETGFIDDQNPDTEVVSP